MKLIKCEIEVKKERMRYASPGIRKSLHWVGIHLNQVLKDEKEFSKLQRSEGGFSIYSEEQKQGQKAKQG